MPTNLVCALPLIGISLILDEFESQLSNVNREHTESKKAILTLNEELRKYKDQCFELETERDRFQREAERNQNVVKEREELVEKVHSEMSDLKEQFADYKKKIEIELEASKQSGLALDTVSEDLLQSKNQCRQMEGANELLREENRALATKVEELQEDIEGMCASLAKLQSACLLTPILLSFLFCFLLFSPFPSVSFGFLSLYLLL